MGSSSLVAVAVAGDGFRPPFTAVQWEELEQQALVYKYLMAGLPVPPELVMNIRRSLEALSAQFFQHSTCKTRITYVNFWCFLTCHMCYLRVYIIYSLIFL